LVEWTNSLKKSWKKLESEFFPCASLNVKSVDASLERIGGKSLKTMKRFLAFLLITILALLLVTPTLAQASGSSRPGPVPVRALPDGIVGEPYHNGRIRPRSFPADTTWDIWEGNPPPPIWSVALYERGLDGWFSPDYSHSDPWDLPMIEDVWYGTLPPGLYLDHIGGLIWGTPTERGKYTIYAPAFLEDGTQRHVPYHSITVREYLETPELSIRTVRDSILQWSPVPGANGYLLYVNGVYARKLAAVTSFDLDYLNLAEDVEAHYINLVAVSTDNLLLDSKVSNSERYAPSTPGNAVYGSPVHPGIVLSASYTVPQTSVHDTMGSFIMMCLSIFTTIVLSVCVFLRFRKIRADKG
jgi:hypothetical protein